MKKHRRKHQAQRTLRHKALKLVMIPAVVGASLVGGFAAAVFTLSGTVEADGKVATPSDPTATAHIATLWPGECSDVSVTVTNDNERPIVIDTIAGTITQQPAGDQGHGTDRGAGNDPAVWRGAANALQDKQVPAGGSASLTIHDAVCLSAKAGGEVAGKDVTATVTLAFHIPAGSEYVG